MKPGAIIAQTKRPDDYDRMVATLPKPAQGNLGQKIQRRPK